MNTGSANGQDWGVIDFPRNQSACWESTAGPEEPMGSNRREVGTVQMCREREKRREQRLLLTHGDQLIRSS